MKTVKVHAKNAFYIRSDKIDKATKEAIDEAYTFRFYDESACAKCELLPDRHSEACDTCAAFLGGAALSKTIKINNNKYISVPHGDIKGLTKILHKHNYELEVDTHHPSAVFHKKIKFTGELRSHQTPAIEAILEKKIGIIKAPPRSGKTVLATAAICKIGKKALIIASQHAWLRGFHETFCGSSTQKPLTNASKKRVGFPKTIADFKKFDVCLVTYQSLIRATGLKKLDKIKNMFGVVVIDEVHQTPATRFAQTIAALNSEYLVGLSGTPERKDQMMILANKLIGPIIYEAKVDRLKPEIRLVRTDYHRVYKVNTPWVSMVSSLEKDPQRLKLIAKWAIKDAKAGHVVMILLTQVTPIRALIMAINKIAGQELAFPYYGGVKRDLLELYTQRARKGKIKIIVGNTKMLSTGLNIPIASCLYEVAMSSNIPNATQRYSRILTPHPNKPKPMIRIFLDDTNVRRKCLANEYWGCLSPLFKPIITEKDKVILLNYFKSKDKSLLDTSNTF